MPLPVITHTRPVVPDEPMSTAAAARLTGMSRHSIEKIVGGGYIDLIRSDVTRLGQEPYIVSGGTLPVIQTDVAEEDGTWRPYTGDALWLSDEDWLLAQSGDWSGISSKDVVEAGYMAVGLGGMVTGLVRVNGRAAGAPAGKIRWNLSLVGRLVGTLRDGQLSFGKDVTPTEAQVVRLTVGMRYAVRRGGAFTWI